MKKLFLAALCAVLFFACGNKKQAEPETLVDTPACQEMVEETPAVEEQAPVAEVQEPTPAPAKKTTAAPKKTTNNNNSGMTATKETQSVKEHAESAANKIANKAIDKAEQDATNAIVNSGKKKR